MARTRHSDEMRLLEDPFRVAPGDDVGERVGTGDEEPLRGVARVLGREPGIQVTTV